MRRDGPPDVRLDTSLGPLFDAPFDRGMAASQLAADGKWTEDERRRVVAAVHTTALRLRELTTDDVWITLRAGFPMTKGIGAILAKAKANGWIEPTGDHRVSRRGGEHDHAQRLTVWRSLVYRP